MISARALQQNGEETEAATSENVLPRALSSFQQNGEETQAATSKSMLPRTLLSLNLPSGMLHVDISKPNDETHGRVWVTSVKPHSPCLGQLQVGDWLESINGHLLVGKGLTYAAELIRSTSSGLRYLQVSRPLAIKPSSGDSIDNRAVHTAGSQDHIEYSAPKMYNSTVRVVKAKENSNNCTMQDPVESSATKMHPSTVRVVKNKENSNNSITYSDVEPADIFSLNIPVDIESIESAHKAYAQMIAQTAAHGTGYHPNNFVAQGPMAAPGGTHNTYAQKVVQSSNTTTTMEPVPPKAAPSVELTVLQQPTATPVEELLLMKEEELQLECIQRGLPSAVGKTTLLENLGVPVQKWKSLRKMKVSELKDILRANGLKVSGKKSELLQRLGVPIGFGETQLEKSQRKMQELKRKQEPEDEPKSNKKAKLGNVKASFDPRDDPSHEEFMEACCNNPSFPAWNDPTPPAGCIHFSDGSVMEVWRCLTCCKIPNYPNAPPVEELPNDESNASLVYDV